VDWSCALGGLAVPAVSRSWVVHWRGYCGDGGSDGTSVDTECTVVRDYGFPVWLGNPAMALVCPIWLRGMARVGGCTAHMAGLLLGWATCQVVSCGAVKSFGEPHSIESSHVGGGSCALRYSRHDFQYPA